ncbi:MAG: thioether cross-link-forming SCIFF peptide maturase [Bacillota bacterium]
MVHCFEILGQRLIFDPASGGLHAVDDVAWDVVSSLTEGKPVPPKYPPAVVAEVLREVEELKSAGSLFTPDKGRELYTPPDFSPKSLCLMVAQECNMRCAYCFAGEGNYGGGGLMSRETALKAVDYLLEASGSVRAVEIDFFGGEPLLNFHVVKAVVAYGTERARVTGKEISFTLTTNALLLDEEKTRFLLEREINVVLSLDGREEVHDRFRRFPDGSCSYHAVLEKAKRFFSAWAAEPRSSYCYLRGTYTRMNLDFSRDFRHLVGEGFTAISLEPVVSEPEAPYAILPEHAPVAASEYEILVKQYLSFRERGTPVRFFHFELDPAGGPCLTKRLTGCGAGFAYLAVGVDGRLYPCHQFVGMGEFCVGDVDKGVSRNDVVDSFRHAHVYNKPCAACWARFFCGGGCHAAAYRVNGDILQPYEVGCILMRKRLECALYIQTQEPRKIFRNAGENG